MPRPIYRPAALVRFELGNTFPNLSASQWEIKSPFNKTYQCIAWAACRTNRKWWPPGDTPETYWPDVTGGVDESVDCFIRTFSTLGYKPCGVGRSPNDDAFEFGYQKVAIYADRTMTATHMARQHFFGRGWLSKLGDYEDILHPNLRDIEGSTDPALREYGTVVQVLKRHWLTALLRVCFFRCWWLAFRFWLYRLQHPSWRTSKKSAGIL